MLPRSRAPQAGVCALVRRMESCGAASRGTYHAQEARQGAIRQDVEPFGDERPPSNLPPMQLRLCKIIVTGLSCVFLIVVVFNNLTDPNSNYQFVRHVLSMDTTLPGNTLMYRSIQAPILHKAFYASIISWEALCCALIGAGTVRLFRARGASAMEWKKAKGLASLGLTAGLVQWYFAFMTVGGEWFLMWQSKTWNGQDAAFRLFVFMGISLLFLNQPDE
jgi:predicted small integral membrane protein